MTTKPITLSARTHGEFLRFECATCSEPPEVHYVGGWPPVLAARCYKCDATAAVKLEVEQDTGFPTQPLGPNRLTDVKWKRGGKGLAPQKPGS